MSNITNAPIKYVPFKDFTNTEHLMCINNENLFRRAIDMGFEPEDFAKKYMDSDFCLLEIDRPYSVRQLSWDGENMDFLLEEITPNKSNKQYDVNIVGYIGYIYRYLQMRLGIPSRLLYERRPFRFMVANYPIMHTHSCEWVVDEIGEEHFPERRNANE